MAEPVVTGFVGFGIGLAAGFGLGYYVAIRRLETKYDKIAQTEIDEARDYYRAAKKATEARLKEPIEEVAEYLGYVKKEDVPDPERTGPPPNLVVEQPIPETVLYDETARSDWVWDQALEQQLREDNPGKPYVICMDEFGEDEFDKSMLTWYPDDEILSDERDEPVDNVDELIGLHNLQRFGHGSDSKHIVMVRNDDVGIDYEIVLSPGPYAADIHGFLQHNYAVERIPRHKQRFDDD